MNYQPWFKYYSEGIPYELRCFELPMRDLFINCVNKTPDQTYLIYQDHTITYKEANIAARKLADGLTKIECKKNDRIAIMAPNIPQYVISIQACFKIGAIIVPVNPYYTSSELYHILNDSKTNTIIIVDRFADKVISMMESGKTAIRNVIVIDSGYSKNLLSNNRYSNILDYEKVLESGENIEQDIPVFSEDTAMLQYTGGTTGLPKGCMLSNLNLEAMAHMLFHWFSPPVSGSNFVSLCALPLYHIYSFTVNLNMNMMGCGTLILVDTPTSDEILKHINKYRPTFFHAVPTMIIDLIQHPDIESSEIKCVRGMMSGGSSLPCKIKKSFEKLIGIDILEGYGLSEATGPVTCTPFFSLYKKGSVGVPFPSTEVCIVDLKDGIKKMPYGKPGELIVRGPQIMSGYWNKPEETELVLKDGWLYTGDIAVQDKNGYVTLIDRKKDLIISSGFNVYCREIEEVLFHHPEIKEACTIGIPHEKRGEVVKAFIVLRGNLPLTKQAVIDYCSKHLARYKVPKEIEFVDSIPRTSVGKPDRKKLRRLELEIRRML